MNHDDPSHRSPPRAEPLQPDRPGQGTKKEEGQGTQTSGEKSGGGLSPGADKLKKQTDNAVENTREGYGGG